MPTGPEMQTKIIYNLNVLKQIAEKSNNANKKYKIQAYQKVIDKINKIVFVQNSNLRNNPFQKVAGESVQNRVNWIVKHNRNLEEVEEFIKDAEEREANEYEESEYEESEYEEGEYEEGEYEEGDNAQSFVPKEDISKRKIRKICNTMKSINSIETLVLNLNLKNELVTNILRDLDKLKRDSREDLFQ